MNRVGSHPIDLTQAVASFVGLLSLLALLLLSVSSIAAAEEQGVVIYEGEGLWVLRQPWPITETWCQSGGGSPEHKVYDVYTYYDVPHERRMQRLGSSYEAFVQQKVVGAIKRLCGPETAVSDVVVTMYRKRDSVEPVGLVDDLSNSKTQPWDSISFRIDDEAVTAIKYEAKEAAYHLTPAELAALDPRSQETLQAAAAATRISDYLLYEGDGFKITSVFDQPGKAWCEHVYVPALLVYNTSDDLLDKMFQPNYESFLQAEIVPKIQEICPNFPDATEYFRQTIRLEFTRAGESRVASFMAFSVAPDGTVAWLEGRQTERQIALAAAQREEQARLAAAAQREEKARQAAVAQRQEQARHAAAAQGTSDYVEVECDSVITGYMHVNTIVPYVKMVSALNQADSKKLGNEMADCFDTLTNLLQLSNPYASGVRFDVFDNSGKSFVQSEAPLTPQLQSEPLHRPDKLSLFAGHWKTEWYEVEISWDWRKSEFIGAIDTVTAKGATLGFKAGDQILAGKPLPLVMVNEEGIAFSATLKLAQTPEPWVVEGGLTVQFATKNMMMFSQGKGDDSITLMFDRVLTP